ncbi:MAG TPA: M15 family metallopeptidase [Aliicoccus persicus]|uniref:M15 family metallopeptidase n=1 Tax=Aliicoccus persicus TaxID=930138 RepID=A0A921DYR4_9STAP|nr:M15 family metallopeptidase [Aliicoccus persicus]
MKVLVSVIGLSFITDLLVNIGIMDEPEPLPEIEFEAYEIEYVTIEDVAIQFLPRFQEIDGVTFINDILYVSEVVGLPETFDPGLSPEVEAAYEEMRTDALEFDLNFVITSDYRSYTGQEEIYNDMLAVYGTVEETNNWVNQPGFSEHQSGLAIDVGSYESWELQEMPFGFTPESEWVAENAHNYGFIIRYPEGYEDVTGMSYEPWHLRYIGVEHATAVYESGETLEHYLNLVDEDGNVNIPDEYVDYEENVEQ